MVFTVQLLCRIVPKIKIQSFGVSSVCHEAINKATDVPSSFSFSKNYENKSDIEDIVTSMTVYPDFLNPNEETSLMNELEPHMKKLRYEFDHWDNAIHGYRETERLKWNEENTVILDRVRKIAFPSNIAPLKFVHILDLDKKGWIKPHIDAVRFCGDTIAGLSLLTDSVMRLVHEKNKDLYVDILLKRRSLYVMKGVARFEYTHEILSNESSIFKNQKIEKDRRISVICRNEPDPKYKN
ncbi:alpha-ketoglutarate-dependent dioxygenase alkB homolog 7, mitochondrial [Sitophilus oryzae]|uniref:Alpha-ketoglutarate-dependent dioxygenase alkB homolog 7, mitochondrial n=1 Tax=Sitophilus oryzae TaxID=7048 RepID=A0A6J2XV75_SITOR|nr:alpha-ketoglutarate-dependent dioxygenase alkB homolog 7, mitochondrial [Sitophilus oryzae]